MNFNDFRDLIKNNAARGRKTEFFKFTPSVDDYRKSKPAGYDIEDTFLADYDRNNRSYIIYYPEKDDELKLKNDDIEEEFYEKGWGTYMHK